jgi:hypothetical protein
MRFFPDVFVAVERGFRSDDSFPDRGRTERWLLEVTW